MSETVKIKFNDKDLEVNTDQTILDVAKTQGVDIPTFCFDDRLKPFSSCFMCVVEVEGSKNLMPSCSTNVAQGMVIKTDTQKVKDTRKMCVDLMLSDHTGDCLAPCKLDCPALTDVQGYVAHIANGDFEAAVRHIKEHLALPIVCGTICPNPCEDECRRGLVDEPIAIRALKRFAAEYDLSHGPFLPETKEDTGKKMAIVGGGPAGLAAAYYLRQEGHQVDLYEALPQLGGMVRYGIPSFRLPWDKLDSEIKSITDLGVNVHFNKKLGSDFTIQDLKDGGADAVLIAIGAHKSKPMWVDNEDAEGVIGGIEFLRKVVLKEEVNAGKTVAVIGGGDVAMDCARVAKRLGADVSLLYRRTQKEMPALQHEQEECEEEGVHFKFLTAPTAVNLDESGKAKSLKVIKMELGEPDDSGRRRPVPVEGSEEDIQFDLIIKAIGQDPDVTCLENDPVKLETTKWKTIVYDTKNMTTPTDGVFSAGDCAWGPETVVRALGEGRVAAKAMHLYVTGAKLEFRDEYRISKGRIAELKAKGVSPRFEQKKRAFEVVHPAEKRLAGDGYAPISLALTEVQSVAEAARCIECGCNARFDCKLRDYATEYDSSEKNIPGFKEKIEKDKRHPFIIFEGEKCINCGSCVRVCSEARDIHALSFVDRGFATYIAPSFNRPLFETDCDSCGMCVDLCPTGAIAINHSKYEGPWPDKKIVTTCTSCGKGCALTVSNVENKIVAVSSTDLDPVNSAMICKEGRFSYQLLKSKDSRKSYTTIERTIEVLNNSKKVAVIITPSMTNEDIVAADELAKKYNGTLYYQVSKRNSNELKPFAKTQGLSNIAFLNSINASPCHKNSNFNKADCLVIIGAYINGKLPKGTPVIALSRFSVGIKAHHQFKIADTLESKGTFLNSDGKLCLLDSLIDPKFPQAYSILAQLAQKNDLKFEKLQKTVTDKVGTTLSDRLTQAKIESKLTTVAFDAKEVAFAKHLQHLEI